MRLLRSSFTAAGVHSQRGLAASATSASMASSTGCISRWANSTPPSIWSSVSSFASDSTMSTAPRVPATVMLSFDCLRAS